MRGKKLFSLASFSRFLLWRCVGRTTFLLQRFLLSSVRGTALLAWHIRLVFAVRSPLNDKRRLTFHPVAGRSFRVKDPVGKLVLARAYWQHVLRRKDEAGRTIGRIRKTRCIFCCLFILRKWKEDSFIQYRIFLSTKISRPCTHLLINKE